ncbi:MAG: Gfo/Idh/MocA family oxidoreductase [Clostridia bacterium]|nr:Gfo/Idh/MocA family oxidoreductase [Clostridia bacterium]
MGKTTVAVIGCGRIARNAHLPAFTKMDSIRVKYACDIIPGKAEKLQEDFPIIENTVMDYKVAVNDPEVEAVFVLTPNDLHYTITMDALAAGKHVFCEKPVAINYEKTLEMKQQADKYGKILHIGVCNRYNRSVEILEQMNKDGKFGNIYHVYCSFRSFRAIPGLGGAFTDKKQSGGGVLIDWGIHFFDLILYILGGAKLKNVTCDAYCEMAKDMKSYKYESMWAEDTADIENGVNDVDDYISGYIRTDKASISFNGAWAQNIKEPEMFIDFLGDKGGARLSYGGQFVFTDGATLQSEKSTHEIPNQYLCEDEGFIQSLKTGEKTKGNIDSILESMKLLQALYDSSAQKKELQF